MSHLTVRTHDRSFVVELTDGLLWKVKALQAGGYRDVGSFTLWLYRKEPRLIGARRVEHAVITNVVSVMDDTVEVTA